MAQHSSVALDDLDIFFNEYGELTDGLFYSLE